MSDLLSAVAQAMGIPESLVERSAAARAAAQGVSLEEVLSAWSGGGALPSAPPAASPEPAEGTASPETEQQEAPPPQVEAPPPPVPAAAAAAAPPPPPPVPVPATVSAKEAAEYEAVTTVPTAGLMERFGSTVPGWLTALFVVVPLAGLLYLITFSGGVDCGEAGQLAVDRQTGEIVNCDGSAFEPGTGVAGGGTDFVALGATVYSGSAACSTCHGDAGQGGVGPAMSGGAVLATFSSCEDHVQWIELGSSGWQAQVGLQYGDNNTQSQGGMPGFASTLTDEELRAVVAFERVRYGGADVAETLQACGLVAPAEGEDGTATTTETVVQAADGGS